MKRNIGFTLSVLTFVFLLSMTSVMACSCIPPRDVLTELNASHAVFQGRVIDMDESLFNYEYTVRLSVDKSWKGVTEDTIEVKTALDSAACGFPFEVNKTYIVYAVEFDGNIWAYSCGRTALIADAQADISELGEPIYMPQTTNGTDNEERVSFFAKIRMWFANLFN